jgi:CheY-like chemotaxis protein
LATPPNSLRVLFVDDEVSLQELMRSELPRLGHEVTVCPDGRSALRVMEKATFDAAILDLKMPDMTGIQVLERLKQVSPDTEAVMMTGYASKETAVEAMRLGAFDYIEKPCKLVEIEAILLKIVERRKLKHQNIALKTRIQAAEGPNRLIGDSPAMQTVQRLIATIAPTDATVLIQARARTSSPGRSTSSASGPTCRSSRSIAGPCRRRWSRVNSSATARGRSPERTGITRASSRSPTAAPCSSTSWANWTRTSR